MRARFIRAVCLAGLGAALGAAASGCRTDALRNQAAVPRAGAAVPVAASARDGGALAAEKGKLAPGMMAGYASQAIAPGQLEGLDLKTLQILRNEIFARHGRRFTTAWVQEHFRKQPWYRADPQYQSSVLNETERANVDLIRAAEKKVRGVKIAAGDMKYYQDQEIQEAWLEGLSERELQIIRAEIEALRGRDFSSEPWLWEHFQNRYWYRPAEYSRSMLNATERKNIEIITGYEKKRRGVAILPGEADRWQAKRLSEADLRGLSLHELRLLRNEFYARRGRTFLTAWLQSYFDAQPWYRAKSGFRDTSVTATDKANIETIVAYEGKLHDSLGTQAVSPSLLADMGQEDARRLRNEIYARHGKRFQDRRLQAYFQSFDWYRPNPGYRDTLLTPIERQNIAKILAHEKEAQVYVDRVEA